MKRIKAFTLVELLVVIGIIALLIAILLPALGRARQSANLIKCQSNLRQMGIGLQLYVNNNRGLLPFGVWANASYSYYTWWGAQIQTMLDSKMPGTNLSDPLVTAWMAKANNSIFRDVDTASQAGPLAMGYLHYTAHPRLFPNNTISPGGVTLAAYRITRLHRVSDHALIFDGAQQFATAAQPKNDGNAFMDGQQLDNWGIWGTPYLAVTTSTLNLNVPIDGGTNRDEYANRNNIRWRHMQNTTANVLYGDGHVGGVRYRTNAINDLPKSAVYVEP